MRLLCLMRIPYATQDKNLNIEQTSNARPTAAQKETRFSKPVLPHPHPIPPARILLNHNLPHPPPMPFQPYPIYPYPTTHTHQKTAFGPCIRASWSKTLFKCNGQTKSWTKIR